MDTQSLNNAARSLPFDTLIGAPLVACVSAQKQAADATFEYFKNVGFKEDKDGSYDAAPISFTFEKDGVMRKLTLPLITILPIPYLQIDRVNIKFRAEMSIDQNNALMAKYSSMGTADINASSTSKYNLQNQLDVDVLASGHAVPGGLNKLLEILGNSVKIEDLEE